MLPGSADTRTVDAALVRATARLHASGSDTPRLDAELLLGHVLGVERSALVAHAPAPLGSGQAAAFEALLERRLQGEPVAYIRGLKEFHAVAIRVDHRVLIPRPETETLVGLALERVREVLTGSPRPEGSAPFLIWDLGTGSGAIAVAVAVELRRRRYETAVRYHLSDVSAEALEVATLNAVAHGVADRMTFALGDLVDVTPEPGAPADLLVANLPYVPRDVVPALPVAASFEPSLALDGGTDGLDVIRRLLERLDGVLAPRGLALLEIGADQGPAIRATASEVLPDWTSTLHPDLAGRDRVLALARSVPSGEDPA